MADEDLASPIGRTYAKWFPQQIAVDLGALLSEANPVPVNVKVKVASGIASGGELEDERDVGWIPATLTRAQLRGLYQALAAQVEAALPGRL